MERLESSKANEETPSSFLQMKLNEELYVKKKLAEYGKDGIEYKNLEPDFSEVSEGTVKIDNMTEHRDDYYDENGELQPGNFSQADAKLAEKWNEQQKRW